MGEHEVFNTEVDTTGRHKTKKLNRLSKRI